ncbi:MAG TPA: hypothetical protein VK476_04935, partial [Flavobacterium sp.]|nr:hypothetical protein [Flavobacterium sp.]
MKKKIQWKIVLSMTISLFGLFTYSQDLDKNVKQKLTDEKGLPTFIVFNENSLYKASDFQQVFKEQLGLRETSSFSKIKSEPDPLGFLHEKFQLFHRGLKVEFATYTLHSKSGKLESMSGEFYDLENANTIAKLNKERAFNRALLQIGAKQYLWDSPEEAAAMNYRKPAGELVMLPISDGSSSDLKLAYKFDIYATSPLSRGDIYIDAVTGNVLFYNATIKHLGKFSHGHEKGIMGNRRVNTLVGANAATRYSGTQSIQTTLSGSTYILADAGRGSGINTFNMRKGTTYTAAVNFIDADNNWTAAEYANTNKDNGALDAHWGAEKTYDY